MVQESLSRKFYPSDLTDEQWAIVEPLIPPAKQSPRGGRPREVDMREVLNTIFYLNRSGCQWDMLPHDLLPKALSMTTLPNGAMTGHGPRWSRPCANEPAWKRGAGRVPSICG
jgi:transposase